MGSQETQQALGDKGLLRNNATTGESVPIGQVAGTGFEQMLKVSGKPGFAREGGAKSGAVVPLSAIVDDDLQSVVDAWPTLPDTIRAGILAMVEAVDR